MLLLWLISAHFLCDYPLQGDFLARGKNHKAPLQGVPWYQCLVAHSVIHGAAATLLTVDKSPVSFLTVRREAMQDTQQSNFPPSLS